jgi:hypothetical protein
MDILFAHASGLNWDEALMIFGGLGLLTLVLVRQLRPNASAAEPVQADQDPTPKRAEAAKRRRR